MALALTFKSKGNGKGFYFFLRHRHVRELFVSSRWFPVLGNNICRLWLDLQI